MGDCIVVLNYSSSSIKFALFDASFDSLLHASMWNGAVEGIGTEHPMTTEAGALARVLGLDAT